VTNDIDLEAKLTEHEAGVADLIAAYELAEAPYFAAVVALAPAIQRSFASNTSAHPSCVRVSKKRC
jgi:hypothetical protein